MIQIGDEVKFTVAFSLADGTPADPTTVHCKLLKPDGTKTTYTYGIDTGLVRDSAGSYHYTLVIDQRGAWRYRFEGIGVVTAADEQAFIVPRSSF